MLLQNPPFRELDSLFDQAPRCQLGDGSADADGRLPPWRQRVGPSRPAGRAADTIDISVERNVLTVTAERSYQREEGDQLYVAERHAARSAAR